MSTRVDSKNDLINPCFPQNEEVKKDSISSLPQEMILEIFSYLNNVELKNCFFVNKAWKIVACNESLWDALMLKSIAFGKNQWQKYFGNVGEEPPLPKDIIEILKSPCPFFQGKKVKETHMLVLIPQTVDGKPLNLTTLGELVKTPKGGHATQYGKILKEILDNEDINQATAQSHWTLMTTNLIPGSIKMVYSSQQDCQDFIDQIVEGTDVHYEIPNVLDIAICIFMQYVRFGKDRPFNNITLCQEYTQARPIPNGRIYSGSVVVGFSPGYILRGVFQGNGLIVHCHCSGGYAPSGMVVMRKFFQPLNPM